MPVDVLIITALFDELQALLRLGGSGWKDESDPTGFRCHLRAFPLANGEELNVAAACSGAMGETATANRARGLIDFLQPLALAMCGICAGRRGDVFLGDVIVADRVFSYDHGKLIASTEDGHRVEKIFHDIETYNLEKAWAMDVAYFAQEWQEDWQKHRPLSIESQRGWLLRSLYTHQEEDNRQPSPRDHPERLQRCPDWTKVLESSQKGSLVTIENGQLVITEKGRKKVLDERILYVDKVPTDPPFRVHLGPIATGKTVRQDPDLFQWLSQSARKVLGVEMEAAAVGWVAELSGIPSIIAKAVSDYGDADKDDGFRDFACRASAEFLLKFLSQYPPRRLNRNKVLTALHASGHPKLPEPVQGQVPENTIPTAAAITGENHDLSTPLGRSKDRTDTYERTRRMFLVHVLTPSDKPGQKYDIFIYVKRHNDTDIADVAKAEFFFGRSWGNRIFTGTREGNRIGVSTSAYGPFLCTCRLTFTDGYQVMLHRYIDFEMGEVVAKLLRKSAG